jgi:1-acyl-sn-glycerol-3-phosphate acyltransferase
VTRVDDGAVVGLPERSLRVARGQARGYLRRRWEIHEHGRGLVPATGPVILASNHIGWLDGPLLVATSPRPPHAMVKEEEFAGRTGRLLRLVAQIKVARRRTDAGAVRTAVRALRAGQCVLIFPEGRRGDGEFTRFKGGVTYLALVTGAPIVPARMHVRPAGAASTSSTASRSSSRCGVGREIVGCWRTQAIRSTITCVLMCSRPRTRCSAICPALFRQDLSND